MLSQLNNGDVVCHLRKALYGLKQAGRNWYFKLDNVLRRLGAEPTDCDPCLYRLNKGKIPTLILTYVDDILIASPNKEIISKITKSLLKEFEVKDIGQVNYCLGIEFLCERNKITLCQRSFIKDLLERYGMADANPVKTPMDVNVKLSKPEGPPSEEDMKLPYRELIGALNYLALATRPDISYSVSRLGQFNNCYTKEHWVAAKRVLRYLKGTADVGITYVSDKKPLVGYADADWAGNTDDRRSCTGFIFMYSGGPISWDSKKQRTVALSSTEAEFMSMTEAVKESIYLQRIFGEVGCEVSEPITLFNDNMGALKLAENPVTHNRTKHIDLRYHFIRDAIKDELVEVKHKETKDMLADLLTKGLPGPRHLYLMGMIGIREVPTKT